MVCCGHFGGKRLRTGGFDASDRSEVSHARKQAARLKEVHGATHYRVQGLPHYRDIRLKTASEG